MACHVYLIHFDQKLCHAGHYLGYTSLESVFERFDRHKDSRGSKLLARLNEVGIDYHVVRIWQCDTWKQARDLERKLKKRKDSPALCPICNQRASAYRYTATVQSDAVDQGIPF